MFEDTTDCMYANSCYIKVSRFGPIQSNKCASSSTWQSISRSGIALQIPMGYYGRIASRSGLAIHHHIHVGAGVVDPDYIGSIHVLLMNFSSQDHVIEKNHPDSPDDSRKSGLSNHLWGITNAPNRAWCQRIWLHRTIKYVRKGGT